MSIQQAMNNMLMSAQFGAGLYAHSPAGKTNAEVSKLKKEKTFLKQEQQRLYEKLDEGIKKYPQDYFYPTAKAKAEAKYAQKFEDIALKIHKEKPSDKSFTSLEEAIANKTEKERAFEARKMTLKLLDKEDLLKYFEEGGKK